MKDTKVTVVTVVAAIAAFSHNQGQKKGGLVISGGYITGNYSAEAGGGVYAGAWNKPLSGFAFYGGIIASNVAQNSRVAASVSLRLQLANLM